jgi:putative aldouronate transport system substrate-binding protein
MASDVMYVNGMNQKGKGWDDPDPGTVGLDGKPAVYKRYFQDLQMPLNTLWYVQNAMILIEGRRFGEQAIGMDVVNKWVTTGESSLREQALRSPSYLLGALIHWCAQDTQNALPDNMFIPPFVFSDADNKRVGDIKAVLDPYLQQAIAEFVTGVRDINSDSAWNAYMTDLDRLGAKERADIYQKYIR